MPQVMKCNEGFSSFGDVYAKGDIVPMEKAMNWPGDTLANRLKNGFIKFEHVLDAAAVAAGAEVGKEPASKSMNKAELIEYAKASFGVELDAKLTTAQVRAEVEKLEAAEAQG